jgi:hypothetical protein
MSGDPPAPRRSRRTLALRIGVPVALVVAGAVLEIAFGGIAGVIGAGLIGVALVLGLANAFYEVGRSEDRERERAAAQRAPSGPEAGNGRAHPNGSQRPGGRPGRPESPREWPPRGRRGPHE